MKTIFSVLLSYIFLCIVGIAGVSVLFMIYFGCMNYVVGQPLDLISFESFKVGFELALPLVSISVPMFLILSLIRHSKKNKIIGIITTTVLACSAWAFALPFLLSHESVSVENAPVGKSTLSSGYFRLSGNSLYYFTKMNSDNTADGIVINVAQGSTEKIFFSVLDDSKVSIPDSEPFSDILVKRTVEFPKLLSDSLYDLYYLGRAGKAAYEKSYANWLIFCLLGVSLICVFMLSGVSRWRLINAFFVIVFTGIVIKANAICYAVPMYKPYLGFLYSANEKLSASFSMFDCPIAVAVNIVLILIMCILGITGKIINHSKVQEDEDE